MRATENEARQDDRFSPKPLTSGFGRGGVNIAGEAFSYSRETGNPLVRNGTRVNLIDYASCRLAKAWKSSRPTMSQNAA